ncbi:MAG: hypothetical protein QXS44_01515 [Saccharolobus sp.]
MSTNNVNQPLTNTVNPIIYSVTLGTTPYHIENTVISGFIYNPNSSPANVVITQSTNGPVTITLQPQEVFNFENVEFTSLTAPTLPLTLIFAESTKEFFRISSQIQSVNITSFANPIRITRIPSYLTASLTTANTPQQITTSSTIIRQAFITNTSTSDIIYVGASTPSIPVPVNNTFVIEMNGDIDQTDLSQWYFVGATAGDSIKVTYL